MDYKQELNGQIHPKPIGPGSLVCSPSNLSLCLPSWPSHPFQISIVARTETPKTHPNGAPPHPLRAHLLQVTYVNTHGTSTPIGDVQELGAVKRVFEETAEECRISGEDQR